MKNLKGKSQVNCLASYDHNITGVSPLPNSNAILNRRKNQYRNVPAGNKLEQLSHPSHPSHPMHAINHTNLKMGTGSNSQATRASFILN